MDDDREAVDAIEIDIDLVNDSKEERSSSANASGMSSSDYELWTKKMFLTTTEVSCLSASSCDVSVFVDLTIF